MTNAAQVCPAELSLHGDAPDWRGCTDCGLCVTACPTQAINASSAQCDRVSEAVSSARGCVVLACGRYEGNADATVACLASLPWDELAAYALKTPIIIKTSPCRRCEDSCAVARIKDTLSRLKGFFGPDEFSKRVMPRVPASAATERDVSYAAESAPSCVLDGCRGGEEGRGASCRAWARATSASVLARCCLKPFANCRPKSASTCIGRRSSKTACARAAESA